MKIQMVNIRDQYNRIKNIIDSEIQKVIDDTDFISGNKVFEFENNLARFVGSNYCVSCANGTDALQIALMAIGAKRGDEIIVPSFTYIATVEVIGLLGLVPVLVDVDECTFNINPELIEKCISNKTKAIIPVHLYGQCADMEKILNIAKKYQLYVIEDNAQAIGAEYNFVSGNVQKSGTMGHIGCTSFYPSKNLGCFGDGGAMFTDDSELYQKLRMISNHGQNKKYHHSIIGCNSRLDTIQAAILDVKLNFLEGYNKKRIEAAQYYSINLSDIQGITTPYESKFSTHVYHQYTIKIKDHKRDLLKCYLDELQIPSMIYYPLPIAEQVAFKDIAINPLKYDVAKKLASSVLSLPIHSEIKEVEQDMVISAIKSFFNSN